PVPPLPPRPPLLGIVGVHDGRRVHVGRTRAAGLQGGGDRREVVPRLVDDFARVRRDAPPPARLVRGADGRHEHGGTHARSRFLSCTMASPCTAPAWWPRLISYANASAPAAGPRAPPAPYGSPRARTGSRGETGASPRAR